MPTGNLPSFSVTTPIAGQILVYDGSNFVNTSKADLVCPAQKSVTGSISIDRTNGEYQRLALTGNIILNISNWPAAGRYGRLVLEIVNGGTFTVTWPTAKWPAGGVPVMSSGSDVYVFYSFDGGSTVYANIVGQNFL